LAVLSALGCVGLIVIGMQPPNEKAAVVVGAAIVLLLIGWHGFARRSFPGPPVDVVDWQKQSGNGTVDQSRHLEQTRP
jgi:hypothetical protein